jgi:cholesterol oxidase
VHDTDWIVVGSGFGGSVSALRLSEAGERVVVLEQGPRLDDDQLPRSTYDLRRYLFAPRLGLRGIFRITPFRDVMVLSGAGVGGGSLVYAMTLYRPGPTFFTSGPWASLADWQAELGPHFDTAERMLGVQEVVADDPADRLLREYARELGVESTYHKARVGAFLGAPGVTVADPYFGGAGPARTGCTSCGACMMGCRVGAKNSLPKNYLWFAERAGATIEADRRVVSVRPLGGDCGEHGWAVTHERAGAWVRRDRQTLHCRGVIVAAGTLGTNQLLAQSRRDGDLPHISPRLGHLVRTNSEALLGVTAATPPGDLVDRVAISSSIHPDANTHIETVVAGRHGDAMRGLFTMLTPDGSRLTRPLKLLVRLVAHPVRSASLYLRPGWSRRSVMVLVMQSLDNAIRLAPRSRRSKRVRLRTHRDPQRPAPRYIPAANSCARWFARRLDGVATSSTMEAAFGMPTTAHVLGGAVIAADASEGVIDARHRVFGYRNLLVCDGSAIPSNAGVNPSLTITAMAERAMSLLLDDSDFANNTQQARTINAGTT